MVGLTARTGRHATTHVMSYRAWKATDRDRPSRLGCMSSTRVGRGSGGKSTSRSTSARGYDQIVIEESPVKRPSRCPRTLHWLLPRAECAGQRKRSLVRPARGGVPRVPATLCLAVFSHSKYDVRGRNFTSGEYSRKLRSQYRSGGAAALPSQTRLASFDLVPDHHAPVCADPDGKRHRVDV